MITAKGFVPRTLEDIVKEISDRLKGRFGKDFNTSPESPDGQLIYIFAEMLHRQEEMAELAYNSFRPSSSFGVALDYIAELSNVKRFANVPTEVSLLLGGVEGTFVPAGSMVATDDNNIKFRTKTNCIIPNIVRASCTEDGDIKVLANKVTKIVDHVDGWTSVYNPEDGDTGTKGESDAQFRVRRRNSLVSKGTSTEEAIISDLNRMGVAYCAVLDNDSTSMSPSGQPAGTIQTVVEGGDEESIAHIIYLNKPAGTPTFGNSGGVIKDSKGYNHTIKFTRPVRKMIHVDIEVVRSAGSSNETAAIIQDSIVNYVQKLPYAKVVDWASFFPAALVTPFTSIKSIKIGLSPESMGTANIGISDIERAWTEKEFVNVEIVK